MFVAIASLVLYGLFVVTQTVAHRDFFLPVNGMPGVTSSPRTPTPSPPTNRRRYRLGLLLVALVAVVGLAKVESPAIEAGVAAVGIPPSFVGVVIALLVLLPEGIAASKAAAAQPHPDQPEPGDRVGDGVHRPDDPRDRGRLDLARPGPLMLGLGRCRSCCSR